MKSFKQLDGTDDSDLNLPENLNSSDLLNKSESLVSNENLNNLNETANIWYDVAITSNLSFIVTEYSLTANSSEVIIWNWFLFNFFSLTYSINFYY